MGNGTGNVKGQAQSKRERIMSKKSQVGNQNLREPLHRGGSADLDRE